MELKPRYLLLADDDMDDCDLFTDALNELGESRILKIVHDGEQLMRLLIDEEGLLPDILFLDLNMPRKNGYECLTEIKDNDRLKNLPVVIFSTSFDKNMVTALFKKGAQYYISKPNEFTKLKQVIYNALFNASKSTLITHVENFVLQP
jgi:CheY-like chemotaxis protein